MLKAKMCLKHRCVFILCIIWGQMYTHNHHLTGYYAKKYVCLKRLTLGKLDRVKRDHKVQKCTIKQHTQTA